jgi:hypothetical protein
LDRDGDEVDIYESQNIHASSDDAYTAKEEEALLENALDVIQNETDQGNTREEAERDRQKLLAGELLVEGGGEEDEEEEEDDIEFGQNGAHRNSMIEQKALVSIAEREAEGLRRSGCNIVSDDELAVVVQGNIILPWRKKRQRM